MKLENLDLRLIHKVRYLLIKVLESSQQIKQILIIRIFKSYKCKGKIFNKDMKNHPPFNNKI